MSRRKLEPRKSVGVRCSVANLYTVGERLTGDAKCREKVLPSVEIGVA